MTTLIRFVFFTLFIRPLIFLILGLNVRHKQRLPRKGPAIIIANHNSHLDTMALMSLLPLRLLPKIHPVAAADYFLKNKWIAWFSLKIIGIIPISRGKTKQTSSSRDFLSSIEQHLKQNKILILFPEGSRGQPEQMLSLKKGVALIAKQNPEVPIYPIFMHGLGKSLPKGTALLVPFVVDIYIDNPLYGCQQTSEFMQKLSTRFDVIKKHINMPQWD